MKYWKLVSIATLSILTACKDSLTIENLENRTVTEGYYNSSERIEQAVIGGYVDLRRALLLNHAWMMYGEVRAGDLVVNVNYQSIVVNQDLIAENRYIEQLQDWGYFYDVIRDANDVLEIVNQADDVLNNYQRNLFKGEALALKSITYFYLARIWGDIASAEKNNFGSRLSNQEAVKLAVSFATEARALLPWILNNNDGIESTAVTKVRFNKTAITLLLAQEELWLGQGQNAYALLNSTFTETTLDSLSGFGISLGIDRRTDIPQKPLDAAMVWMPLDTLNAVYPLGDTRRTALFNIVPNENSARLIVKEADMLELLPLAELNLLLAEAAWRTGSLSEGREYLITASSGATEDYSMLTEQTFGDALLQERRRLLVGTGQRMFDLIRFNKVSTYIPKLSENDVQEGAGYWPLSLNSLKGNSWNQNAFWSRP
jgi:hypothetical protein